MSKEENFKVGASYTIGSYILPGEPVMEISEKINRKVNIKITTCDDIIDGVKQGDFSLGLIESPLFDDELIYTKWMDDKLVVCASKPLPESLSREELKRCRLIARKKGSPTRSVITNFLETIGLSYDTFESLSEIDNPTAVIQNVKWAKPHKEYTTVGIVSQISIQYELDSGTLYKASIEDKTINREFYIIYKKEDQNRDYIKKIETILKNIIPQTEDDQLAS